MEQLERFERPIVTHTLRRSVPLLAEKRGEKYFLSLDYSNLGKTTLRWQLHILNNVGMFYIYKEMYSREQEKFLLFRDQSFYHFVRSTAPPVRSYDLFHGWFPVSDHLASSCCHMLYVSSIFSLIIPIVITIISFRLIGIIEHQAKDLIATNIINHIHERFSRGLA